MKNNRCQVRPAKGVKSGMAVGGISFAYVSVLIILPIIAITIESLKGGLPGLWQQITHPQALHSLKLTFLMALYMVLINIVTGTATAWVLVRCPFPMRRMVDALVDIPFAIPTVVTGMMLVLLYGPKSMVGMFMKNRGIDIIYDTPGIVLALVFVTFPFVVRAVQPVLLEMDREMEEAAYTLGATHGQTFRRVILPGLMPAILTGAALSLSRALGEFGSIVMVAGNIPMKTQVGSVYIYGEVESANLSGAMGVSVVLLSTSVVILAILNLLQRWSRKYDRS